MKLSIFTTVTYPARRGDNIKDALKCYEELADEIIIIDGSINGSWQKRQGKIIRINNVWPKEFDWPFIGQQFQRGYDACTGDWVIHMDLDFIFHQRDFGKIRQALRDYPNAPAISFYKHQFILPDRYNLKSRLPLAVNKKMFGDRIKFNGGGDLCQPTLDGKDFDLNEIPQAGVPFYNYEKLTKTQDQIMDDQGRMERAYFRHFKRFQLAEDDTDESSFDGWLKMQRGRFNKPQEHISLDKHPKYIQETIKNLTPDQWGFSGFGLLEANDYVKSSLHSR